MPSGKHSKISDDRDSRGLKLSMRPSCLKTSDVNSGSSSPQKIIDIVFPIRISDGIRKSPTAPALEEALSISLLEDNGRVCVSGGETETERKRERERQRGKKEHKTLQRRGVAQRNSQDECKFTERAKVAGRRIQAEHDRAAAHVREKPMVADIVCVVGEPVLRSDVDLPELFVEHK